MKTNVIITFKVKPGRIAGFREILESVKSDLPKVTGCTGVKVFNSTKNTNIFTLVESWDSEELHKKHIQGVIESGGWEVIASHLESDPDSAYYTEV
jgi:quinol monooxygenase YgiN